MQGDLSILYALMGVVIFLALMAALGAWVRGGGLKRDEAENLFADSQERHREEVSRLQAILEETRMAAEQVQAQTEAAMAAKLRELDEHVTRTQSELQAAVAKAANEQKTSLSEEMELVSSRISESERNTGSNINELSSTLQNVQTQVALAGEQVRNTLMEITRQQQEQKAQSTIQLCEALITSLGTLKSSISQQLTTGDSAHTVDAEETRGELTGPDYGNATNAGAAAESEEYSFDGLRSQKVDEDASSNETTFSPGETDNVPFAETISNIDSGEDIASNEAKYNPATGESSYIPGSGNSGSGNNEAEQEPRAFNWTDTAAASSEDADTHPLEDKNTDVPEAGATSWGDATLSSSEDADTANTEEEDATRDY